MKFMNMKRFGSIAMAGALAMSLTAPAFASGTTTITGKYQDIELAVMVPTTGTAQINPYGLPVELDSTNSISGEQVVTKPLAIANKSSVDLSVSATVTAEAKGGLMLATTAPSASLRTKSAFIYLQMKHSDMANSDLDDTDAGVSGFKAANINAEAAAWSQAYSATKDLVLNGAKEATKENMIVLAKADSTGEIQSKGVGLFRLAGQVVASPTEAWAEADGFSAAVAFTFRPDTTAAALDKTELTINKTTATTATLTASLTGANIVDVVWASDGAAATVAGSGTNNTTGTVTGVSNANNTVITATITADNGLTYTAECTVITTGF